jgi:hypothetical protein
VLLRPHPAATLRGGLSLKPLALFLLFGAALLTSGCPGMFKGKRAAEQGVAVFHRLYNEGKLKEIYDTSHSKMKAATPEKELIEFLDAVLRKLGKVTETKNAGFNVGTFNFVTTVVLTQNTTFEHGSGAEVFTFEMNGDNAVLVGYNINSKDLVLK